MRSLCLYYWIVYKFGKIIVVNDQIFILFSAKGPYNEKAFPGFPMKIHLCGCYGAVANAASSIFDMNTPVVDEEVTYLPTANLAKDIRESFYTGDVVIIGMSHLLNFAGAHNHIVN